MSKVSELTATIDLPPALLSTCHWFLPLFPPSPLIIIVIGLHLKLSPYSVEWRTWSLLLFDEPPTWLASSFASSFFVFSIVVCILPIVSCVFFWFWFSISYLVLSFFFGRLGLSSRSLVAMLVARHVTSWLLMRFRFSTVPPLPLLLFRFSTVSLWNHFTHAPDLLSSESLEPYPITLHSTQKRVGRGSDSLQAQSPPWQWQSLGWEPSRAAL